MARSKVARVGESPAPNRPQAAPSAPLVHFIHISADNLARDPFRYISDPPRMPGEKKHPCVPDE